MPEMNIELDEEEDKLVELYKATHNLPNKKEAVRQMIRGYKKADKPISSKPEVKAKG